MTDHRPIEVIREELDAAHDRARALGRELREALYAAAPVKVGDIVRVTQSKFTSVDNETYEALVCRVDVQTNPERPYIRVRRRNKGGEWGKAVRQVWGKWEVIGHEESPS